MKLDTEKERYEKIIEILAEGVLNLVLIKRRDSVTKEVTSAKRLGEDENSQNKA